MSLPTVGSKAPAWTMLDQEGKEHSLSDYTGEWVVLYFYPKDDTPGCTKEACAFRDNLPKFKKINANVFGVSVDPVKKHAKFAEEKAKIEESIRRGFALLRRDIEEEMELLSYSKLNKDMSQPEKEREEQLLRDLETVKRQIGEEVWELEKLGE
jgi:alkyl hydroperoxide reductase subunit AhpC